MLDVSKDVVGEVKEYYGKTLSGSVDLKTDACCTMDAPPEYLLNIMRKIHPEVSNRYYGCGLVAPQKLEGLRILDLGSGSGHDCYILSALVGEEGEVIGVDMTDEQLEVANNHIDFHAETFGYQKPNTRFLKGYLEKLDELDLEPNSFDLIVSNCVINLSQDKRAVLEQAYNLLKPGGEIYFSDVYSDRRVPESLVKDPLLYGECLSGALYWNDFLNLSKRVGFTDPRLVTDRRLEITDPAVISKIGHIAFYSATYRLFKLEGLEPECEDYGQAVIYRGGIEHSEQVFFLDGHHRIELGKVFPVCGNTWKMLKETRFSSHFEFIGNVENHYGIFEGCGVPIPFASFDANEQASCC